MALTTYKRPRAHRCVTLTCISSGGSPGGSVFSWSPLSWLRRTVAKVEWINPHSWIHVDVKSPDGKVERWMIEGGNPTVLMRRGLTRDSLPIGTEILVEGYRAKGNPFRANGRDLTFPDGRKLFMGSSGTGAPLDGRDASEKK